MNLPGSIYSYYRIFVCNICTLYSFSPRNPENSEQARRLFRKEVRHLPMHICYIHTICMTNWKYLYTDLSPVKTFEFIAVIGEDGKKETFLSSD